MAAIDVVFFYNPNGNSYRLVYLHAFSTILTNLILILLPLVVIRALCKNSFFARRYVCNARTNLFDTGLSGTDFKALIFPSKFLGIFNFLLTGYLSIKSSRVKDPLA